MQNRYHNWDTEDEDAMYMVGNSLYGSTSDVSTDDGDVPSGCTFGHSDEEEYKYCIFKRSFYFYFIYFIFQLEMHWLQFSVCFSQMLSEFSFLSFCILRSKVAFFLVLHYQRLRTIVLGRRAYVDAENEGRA